MAIQFRHADVHDGHTIVNFIQATLQEMESVGGHEVNRDEKFWQCYRQELAEFIRMKDRLYLIAELENSEIGLLEGKIIELPDVFTSLNSFHIRVVYVAPNARRRGVATALVREALRWAAKQSCREADLNVLSKNDMARGLYKKIGFEVFQHKLRLRLPLNA